MKNRRSPFGYAWQAREYARQAVHYEQRAIEIAAEGRARQAVERWQACRLDWLCAIVAILHWADKG